jgi:hypothetical protein
LRQIGRLQSPRQFEGINHFLRSLGKDAEFPRQPQKKIRVGDYYLRVAISQKMLNPVPTFALESSFYRHYLRIDPATGAKYRALGLIVADAQTSSGKPLFLVTAGNLAAVRKRIARHKRQQRKLNAH